MTLIGRLVARMVVAGGMLASLPFVDWRANAAQVPESLLPLLRDKENIATALAETAAQCVCRKDTKHAAFHGCVDWHSSVHGVWALSAFARATGDTRHNSLVMTNLIPKKLATELQLLRRQPSFEMPYGRAWFLRLALENSRSANDAHVQRMGNWVFFSLMRHYRAKNGIDPRSGSYNSASWALINMHDYAKAKGNTAALTEIRSWIARYFAIPDATCDPAVEAGHFMAVCTNWAWLVSYVKPREELVPWLDKLFSKHGLPGPVVSPTNWHHHGLNFSRAWGLWEIYSVTGELKYANAYAAHFRSGYDEPSKWRGDYLGVGHWVPQFGMFALQPLFGNRGR